MSDTNDGLILGYLLAKHGPQTITPAEVDLLSDPGGLTVALNVRSTSDGGATVTATVAGFTLRETSPEESDPTSGE